MDKPLKLFALISMVFFGFLAIIFLAHLKDQSSQKLPAQLDANDPMLVKAKSRATQNIDTLFKLFPEFPQHTFIKFPRKQNDGGEIHAWAKLINLDRDHAEVEIDQESVFLPIERIEDWLVEIGNGKVRGGFTTQVILMKENKNGSKDSVLNNFLDRLH